MKKIQFIFGIHLHQPVGNFDWVIEEAYQKSYLPILDTIKRYPTIAIVLHISGSLLERLEHHHPEYLDVLSKIVATHRIEILGGGFYEPVLAVIPDHDKVGQIKKLNKYIKNRFNYVTEGIWLTERVWEPHLVKPISTAGIKYTTVDDFHFLAAGREVSELDSYFTTDEQDARLGIFPISQKLRYAIPFQEPSETINYLRSIASTDGKKVIVMADDAEKFGVWPGTYDTCFGGHRWFERFFQALVDNRDWLKTTTFKDYFNTNKPKDRIYLPSVSYFEMSEWTLPAKQGEQFTDIIHNFENNGEIEKYRPYLRGGMWRNFQNLYDESNWMQKRITDLSIIFQKYMNKFPIKKRNTIQDNVWRAQCNCAFWHGAFGGLYLPHLRHGIFQNLIAADKEVSKILPPFVGTYDLDNDGYQEVDLVSDQIKIIASSKGGQIREFDIFSKNFNLLNTMHQYLESYHRNVKKATTQSAKPGSIHDIILAKEENLEKFIHIDKNPRYSLIDHFFPANTSLSNARENNFEKGNFADQEFSIRKKKSILFTAEGLAFGESVVVTKKINLNKNIILIEIKIKNIGNTIISGLYASELNFALLGGHSDDRYYQINGKKPDIFYLDSAASERKINEIEIVNGDDKFVVQTKFFEATDLWRFPIFTVSGSEAGFEKVYQSSVIMPKWKIKIQPNNTKKIKYKIIVKEL